MRRLAGLMTALTLGVLLPGCAQMYPGYSPTPRPIYDHETPGTYSGGVYSLSADEKALDCKQLTGRMQLRILETRDYYQQPKTSDAAQKIQGAVVPIFGGTKQGINPDSDYARERAKLEAYNKELAARGCGTFNLEDEMRPKPLSDTPEPGPAAKKSP